MITEGKLQDTRIRYKIKIMIAKLKSLFHKMPDGFQTWVINIVGVLVKKKENFQYHRPFQKKVVKVLTNMGYEDICPYKRNTWKILPIFSQYYVAKNEQGKKCFCKFSILNDNYGCITREAEILKKLNSRDNIPTLREAIPDYVDYVKEESFGLEGVIYQWLENTEAIGSDNIKTRDDIEKLNDFFKRIYLEMSEVGLIHVDIRPVNVLVDKENGSFKLIDFGLSYVRGANDDVIYGKKVLPYSLRNTGCRLYNPKDGVFDDAYSFLYTLKEVYMNYKKEFKQDWLWWNHQIGKHEVKLEMSK